MSVRIGMLLSPEGKEPSRKENRRFFDGYVNVLNSRIFNHAFSLISELLQKQESVTIRVFYEKEDQANTPEWMYGQLSWLKNQRESAEISTPGDSPASIRSPLQTVHNSQQLRVESFHITKDMISYSNPEGDSKLSEVSDQYWLQNGRVVVLDDSGQQSSEAYYEDLFSQRAVCALFELFAIVPFSIDNDQSNIVGASLSDYVAQIVGTTTMHEFIQELNQSNHLTSRRTRIEYV